MLDVLRRVMRDVCGYNMILIQNVTDIDDKIITKSKESKTGETFREIAARFENEFNEDMKAIGVSLRRAMDCGKLLLFLLLLLIATVS